jgi:hypothetical protein
MRTICILVGLLGWLEFAVAPNLQGAPPESSNVVAETIESKKNPPQAGVLQIEVLPDNWGGSPTGNIQAVCESAGRELVRYFPERTFAPISISNNFNATPITLYKKGAAGEIRVKLTTRGLYWSQYAYQFGHELGHILCNYREAENPQLWFEESLCETASIFVLRKMADTWQANPPYPNWKSFANSLDNYADEHLSNTAKYEEKTFAEWYRNHRIELEKSGTNRALNQIVAVRVLLPLLQNDPRHWEALSYLNQWDVNQRPSLTEYLKDWHQRVPKEHKKFVQAVATRFEIALEE